MWEYQAQVISVHDGDTLRLDVDLGFSLHHQSLDCRYLGFDAPELRRADHLGEGALAFVKGWLVEHPGPYVLHTAKDRTEKFGRYLLASLTAPDTHELVADQITAGWARPYSGKGQHPW